MAPCLTGDWRKIRPQFSEKGVDFTAIYIGEVISNLSGGLRRGTTYEGLLNTGVDLDFEKLVEWKGAQFHVNSFWIHGSSPTAKYVGDLQTLSNIDAFDTLRLNELWLQQNFCEDRFSFKLGMLAADTELMTSDYAGLFFNGAFGWPAALALNVPTPAYPIATPGMRVRIQANEKFYFQSAVFDGDPDTQVHNDQGTRINLNKRDGLFSVYEFGCKLNQEKKSRGLPGTYKVGVWLHTDSFVDRQTEVNGVSLANPASTGSARIHSNNYGFYGVIDQMIFKEASKDEESDQGMSVFFRGVTAPNDRNLVSLQLMGGINYTGLIPGRDEDQIGLGVTHIEMSDQIQQFDRDSNLFNSTSSPVREYETTLELTYRYCVSPWWNIQPDLQWVLNPGGSSAVGDAFVAGLRFNIIF